MMKPQSIDTHPKAEAVQIRPSQELFFKPAETEVREYARILEHATHEKADLWITRLSSLSKGECYAVGPSLNPATGQLEEKAFRIKITVIGERIDLINRGGMGTTDKKIS